VFACPWAASNGRPRGFKIDHFPQDIRFHLISTPVGEIVFEK
jgi:hypothetical protein